MYTQTIDIQSHRDRIIETTYNGGTVTLRRTNGRTMTVRRGFGNELTEAGWPILDDFVITTNGGAFRTVRGDNTESIMRFLSHYSFTWISFTNK